MTIRRIGVNTGGGDAPGLNAVIRAVVLSALRLGWEVVGIRQGYAGLIDTTQCVNLGRDNVRGITHIGGTILGTTNKGNPFERQVKNADGTTSSEDVSAIIMRNYHQMGLDALVAIGGDGSLKIARRLAGLGMKVVGVPKTIDNDVSGTEATFGYHTAVATAVDAIDKLHPTAEAHERVMVVEVMGRYVGWIALQAGVSATADVVLIPEIPFDIDKVCEKIRERESRGRRFSIVVVAEGAKPVGGGLSTLGTSEVGREVRLGGVGERVAKEIQDRTGKETRVMVLGHLQRGGGPNSYDRVLALRFGCAAVRAIQAEQFGTVMALQAGRVVPISLDEAVGELKRVPLDCDLLETGRSLGISFGD